MEISDLMLRDHCKIEKLLSEFKLSIGSPEAEKRFDGFKWELEKHMFIEERAIFTFVKPEDNEDFAAIPKLKREHDEILDLMESIEKDTKEEDVSKLQNLLMKHKTFEDEVLYPKLDVELNAEQKKIIVDRLMKFISG